MFFGGSQSKVHADTAFRVLVVLIFVFSLKKQIFCIDVYMFAFCFLFSCSPDLNRSALSAF